jgi:hypothetical protein
MLALFRQQALQLRYELGCDIPKPWCCHEIGALMRLSSLNQRSNRSKGRGQQSCNKLFRYFRELFTIAGRLMRLMAFPPFIREGHLAVFRRHLSLPCFCPIARSHSAIDDGNR